MTIAFLQGIILVLRLLVPITLGLVIVWTAMEANKRGKNALLWSFATATAFLVPFRAVREIVLLLQEGIEKTGGNIFARVVFYHLPPIVAGALVSYAVARFIITRYGD